LLNYTKHKHFSAKFSIVITTKQLQMFVLCFTMFKFLLSFCPWTVLGNICLQYWQSCYNCGAFCYCCWQACVWCTQNLTLRKNTERYWELATFTSQVSDITGQCVLILSDNYCVVRPAATSLLCVCVCVGRSSKWIFWWNKLAASKWNNVTCK